MQRNTLKPNNIKNDLLSGVTVALALVPEAIAFSFVANVDPQVGLYAAFIMGLITAIIGGRPGMISGATGAIAVIFAPLVIEQTKMHGIHDALGYLFLAVIFMGLIQILFGVLKLGKLIRLIPYPVMLGFINGLAIIILVSQFEQFYVGGHETKRLLDTIPLLLMGGLIALTMSIGYILPRFTKAVPATLVAIIVVTILSAILRSLGLEIYTVLDFVQGMNPAKTTIALEIPRFRLPAVPFNLNTIRTVLPYSLLAAAVGLIESLMTLSLIDELTRTRGRGNKESIGQGIANLLNGFFGGMGGCAMIGQSMINIRAGGRGRLSGASAAFFLLMFMIFGAALIEQIPLAALVGVMFIVVIATFEWSSFRIIKSIPRSDAFVIVLVSLTTVFFNLAIAVLVGVIVSGLTFAWEQGKKITLEHKRNEKGYELYKIHGALFFASASNFKQLFDFSEINSEDVIIDLQDTRIYDHSGIEALNSVAQQFASINKKVHLLNLSKECQTLIEKANNIVEISIIDTDHFHLADNKLG